MSRLQQSKLNYSAPWKGKMWSPQAAGREGKQRSTEEQGRGGTLDIREEAAPSEALSWQGDWRGLWVNRKYIVHSMTCYTTPPEDMPTFQYSL